MAGLEIFGATIAALDITTQIVRAVYTAVTSAVELSELLDSHQQELLKSKIIVKAAQDEPEVRKSTSVQASVESIGASALAVQKHLEKLGGRGFFKEMAHQLLKGKQERKSLQKLMDKLTSAKADLTTSIGVLNVSLASTLRERLNNLSSQLANQLPSSTTSRFRSRIVTNNATTGQGFMLNGPLQMGATGLETPDPYKDIDYLLIDGNRTGDLSTMINYPTTVTILESLADRFLAKIRSEVSSEEEAHDKQ
ncbi:hypothetical protein F4860DRAFT_499139 [Xylaria cubensis]|nr:hypothetical protein F4860DRAFT_499139 [Xylaria cubensis]